MLIINTYSDAWDADLLAAARDLCADRGKDSEYVDGIAELLIAVTPGLQNVHLNILTAFLGAPSIDPNGPMTDDQRRALFAAMRDVFGDYTDEQRYAVTRLALGRASFDVVSWSRYGAGRLTAGEASRVLDYLQALNV